jgi:anti-sigma regulatory factor (Ser/Thr protein kinase)
MTPVMIPSRLELDDPVLFLRWLGTDPVGVDLGSIDPVEMWGLVALSTLGRPQGSAPLRVRTDWTSRSCQFARAVGFDDLIDGRPVSGPGEPGRTVKLTRIRTSDTTEPLADSISRLLITENRFEDTRRTVYYVLNELLRNVVQHSRDPLGGVVGAQVNWGGRNADRPAVQVAVADSGIGIPASLLSRHRSLTDPREALARSLWPHVSSTFDEGETGSAQNAGMGLFFIAEMTKLVGGRLVIASRGATLILKGDEQFEDPHGVTSFLEPGVGFPGTLVAFEMPSEAEQNYDAMIETIRERARERTPRRAVHKWLAFEEPPSGAQKFIVRQSRIEDTVEAQRFAEEKLIPRLFRREPVVLDFGGIPVCTQSYVHALLFEPLRIAWARKAKIYILNAQPAVRSTLELLENYALGG